jgi:hypothetical protein
MPFAVSLSSNYVYYYYYETGSLWSPDLRRLNG